MRQCIYRNVILCPSYIICNWPFGSKETSYQYPSFLASEFLQHNVIALVKGNNTKIPACTVATIINIPLINLHGNYPSLNRCAKAIQLSADFKDYAHASLDIINTFHWKNVALVADGRKHWLYCFRIRLFVSLFASSYTWSFVCPFARLFECFWSCMFVWSFLVVCSGGRLFVWLFGFSVVCSCGCGIFRSFFSLGRLVVSSYVRLYSICLFLVFSEGSFPEAVYFYGISQDSKFTLNLLQLTEKEGTNGTNENGKASIQRLAEKIVDLDPEVVLLYITEEKIKLLMTQAVC